MVMQVLNNDKFEELKRKSGGDIDYDLFSIVFIGLIAQQHVLISTEAINYVTSSIQMV